MTHQHIEFALGLLCLIFLLVTVWLFGVEHGYRKALDDDKRLRTGKRDDRDT